MKGTYKITGMTCMGCVKNVKAKLLAHPGISDAEVKLEYPQAEIVSDIDLDIEILKAQLGKYDIEKIQKTTPVTVSSLQEKSINTYKPLIIIILFILGVTILAQYPFADFSFMLWMRHFMAGFFIVFAFFKILNVSGFADSYAMYDIVAEKWKGWGYLYPFVELTLGVFYLINFMPVVTNLITITVLGISTIGVVRSNLRKEEIKCACLGDVFNLPMSTVTIIEDVAMLVMAMFMLVYLN